MTSGTKAVVERANTTALGFQSFKIALFSILVAGVSHAALALPSGAAIQSGAVVVSRSPNRLTVTQSSTNAIINWTSFSIDQSGAVQINNGSGATLNRVTGPSASTIEGMLSATGSVYLINPNGIIIGKTGVVNVGGNFAASTLDDANNSFGATGDVELSGASTASVVNQGAITALGGIVILAGAKVVNAGSIAAPNADVGLLAGSDVLLLSDPAAGDGRFSVRVGGAGTYAKNLGAIAAAAVELRANQGNVYALAGNTTGVINATAVSNAGGDVLLVAEGGETVVGGSIGAAGAAGTTGGKLLTSGSKVELDGPSVSAGTWTIQENSFVLTSPNAATLAANLATTAIVVQTLGSGASGDIALAASLNWSSANDLTFSARRNIVFQDGVTITDTGYGGITLAADNQGHGVGSVLFGTGAGVSTLGHVAIYYDPPGDDNTSINSYSYTNPTDFSGDVSAGLGLTSYMLVNTVYDLQNIQNNLSGDYALGRNIDAGATAAWNGGAGFTPIGYSAGQSPALFTGLLSGGPGGASVINNLTIYLPTSAYVGLFADIGSSGSVNLINLKGGSVTGADTVGALAGENDGMITSAYANTTVTGLDYTGQGIDGYDVGGLVGVNTGSVYFARADGQVSGFRYVGGLVGDNQAQPGPAIVAYSSAAGAVRETGGGFAGGLVGLSGTNGGQNAIAPTLYGDRATGTVMGTYIDGGLAGAVNSGLVTGSSATGLVYTPGGYAAGGLIGFLGNVETATVTYSHASGGVLGAFIGGGLIGVVDDEGDDGVHVGSDVISNIFATGAVGASGYAGGLIGALGDGRPYNNPTLTKAYATGYVFGGAYSGGLVAYSSGSVSYAFWNTQTTGQSSDGAQAVTSGDPTTGSIGLSGAAFTRAVKAAGGGE